MKKQLFMKQPWLMGLVLGLGMLILAQAATIAKVTITGNSSIPTDALEHNLKMNGISQGKDLNPERLEVLRQHVLGHYRYFRRHEAQVETRLKPLDNGHVEVELFIDESTWAQGLPEGYNNDPYAEDIYTESKVTDKRVAGEHASATPDADNELANENETNKELESDAENEAEDENSPEGTVSLGLGYGNKGTHYKASFIKRRLFDTDASMRLSALHDEYETNIDLGISKPNFIKPGLRLDTNIFYDAFDNSHSRTVAPYKRKSYGLQAILNVPIDKDSSYYGGVRYTHNRLKDVRPEYSRALYLDSIGQRHWDFKANDFDLLLGWKFNNFNKKFLPTKGIGLKLEGSASLPGSDNRFYKVKLDAEGYYPLNEKQTWLVAAKASLGYAKGMSGRQVSFYQNFTAGGLGTLRGFAYGTVGPRALYSSYPLANVSTLQGLYRQTSRHVVGGNALAAGSLELIVPSFYLSPKYQSQFRTALFVDAASVWETNQEHIHPLVADNARSGNVRVSAGLSLQWQFPLGVLSLSYAVPIKKYAGDRLEQFQLNISGSF